MLYSIDGISLICLSYLYSGCKTAESDKPQTSSVHCRIFLTRSLTITTKVLKSTLHGVSFAWCFYLFLFYYCSCKYVEGCHNQGSSFPNIGDRSRRRPWLKHEPIYFASDQNDAEWFISNVPSQLPIMLSTIQSVTHFSRK